MESENQIPTPQEPQTTPPDSLDKVINESRENLAEKTQTKKRGRPVGWRKHPANDAKPPGGGDVPPLAEGARTVNAEIFNEVAPLATEAVKTPFELAKFKLGDLDITPTDEEAKAPARYLTKLIQCYLPDLETKDVKTFNWVAFAISYGLLILKKLRKVVEAKAHEKSKAAPVVENEKGEQRVQEEAEEYKGPSRNAAELFGGRS